MGGLNLKLVKSKAALLIVLPNRGFVLSCVVVIPWSPKTTCVPVESILVTFPAAELTVYVRSSSVTMKAARAVPVLCARDNSEHVKANTAKRVGAVIGAPCSKGTEASAIVYRASEIRWQES